MIVSRWFERYNMAERRLVCGCACAACIVYGQVASSRGDNRAAIFDGLLADCHCFGLGDSDTGHRQNKNSEKCRDPSSDGSVFKV